MIEVKELKDDSIIDIKVNKNFYLMCKNASYTILTEMIKINSSEEYVKDCITKSYDQLDDHQKCFYTLALLLAEIETQATSQDKTKITEVLEKDDEGYVEPKSQD
jgi:hypothetical protein